VNSHERSCSVNFSVKSSLGNSNEVGDLGGTLTTALFARCRHKYKV